MQSVTRSFLSMKIKILWKNRGYFFFAEIYSCLDATVKIFESLSITTFAYECPLAVVADIPIAPAIPIRHGLRGIGLGVKNNKGKPSPLKVPISAADPGAVELGHEHAQANPAKENDATNLEATRCAYQNVAVDVPVGSVSKEATEPETTSGGDAGAYGIAILSELALAVQNYIASERAQPKYDNIFQNYVGGANH
ncbi:hypothetical protein ACJX0J_033108 [Zea mays]